MPRPAKKRRVVRDLASELKPVRRITLTPTWVGLMPAYIAILRDPKAPYMTAHKPVMDELMKLARFADGFNRDIDKKKKRSKPKPRRKKKRKVKSRKASRRR